MIHLKWSKVRILFLILSKVGHSPPFKWQISFVALYFKHLTGLKYRRYRSVFMGIRMIYISMGLNGFQRYYQKRWCIFCYIHVINFLNILSNKYLAQEYKLYFRVLGNETSYILIQIYFSSAIILLINKTMYRLQFDFM